MKNYGMKLFIEVIVRGAFANIIGACLMTVYFIFFSINVPSEHPQTRIVFTVILAVVFCMLGLSINLIKPEPKKMYKFFKDYLKSRPDKDFELEVIDYTAGMPWEAAKISFNYWLAGGILFTLLFYFDSKYKTIFGGGVKTEHTPFIFFGVVGIGGIFSSLFTFLFTERMVSSSLKDIFLKDLMMNRKPVKYMNLRTRILILFTALSVIPILAIGIITLTNDISQIRSMIFVIVMFGIVMSIISSGYISRSISVPIKEIIDSFSNVRDGRLDSEVMISAPDDIGDLQYSFNHMLKGLKERDYIKEIFGRYVTRQVVDRVLSGDISLGGQLKEATILILDIRGFTKMSEKLSPPEVVDFLNGFLTDMVEEVINEEGRLDKFLGDGFLSVFGAPQEHADDPDRACRVALRIRANLKKINRERVESGKEPVKIGIAIHSGPVVAGNIGSEKKMEYTVIGDAVNVTSRIESLNKIFESDILISEETYKKLSDKFTVEEHPEQKIRGKEKLLKVYSLVGRED